MVRVRVSWLRLMRKEDGVSIGLCGWGRGREGGGEEVEEILEFGFGNLDFCFIL